MLLEVSTAGYRMAHLPEAYALGRAPDWAAPLPAFEEVAHGNLLYDKRDARLLKVRSAAPRSQQQLLRTGLLHLPLVAAAGVH
jgi:hypothetical protein